MTSRSAPSMSNFTMSGRAFGIEAARLSRRREGVPVPSATWLPQDPVLEVFNSNPRLCDHRAA